VRNNNIPPDRRGWGVKLFRQDYNASAGKEIFLSFEDKERKNLYSLLRLRINENNTATIREVHTYGKLVQIKSKNKKSPQHTGLGKKLIIEAERITQKEFGIKKIAVISGVGVRDYYRKLGYRLEDGYMVKYLKR
jgi:elongator complex protein 3